VIPRTARQAREAGFTLIELLVALTLLAVLMAALFGALRLGTRVWETGEARLDASTRVQVVQDFLRQQLSQTVPMTEITNNPRISGAMLFTGASRELRFVSLLPGHLGAGVSLMELAARPRPRGGRSADLVIRIRPLDLTDDAGTQSETEERVLVEGIESIELAYFGAERAGTEPVWWQEWQDQRALPTLIRLRVGFAKDDHRRWPELLVSPMVDLPPPFQL
jgi:general secretion pathway protein J